MSKTDILLLNPKEYFHAAVAGAIAELKIRASDHAQQYLVNLLSHYVALENLYPTSADGKSHDTLTEKLADALSEESIEGQTIRLRQLGDFSLYIAGFFSDSLQNKLVDVDYYISMGGAAYEKVAQLQDRRADLFTELSFKFPLFVDVLAQVSEQSLFANKESSKELLRKYDLWNKTGSERLAKQLIRAGVLTHTNPKLKPDEEEN